MLGGGQIREPTRATVSPIRRAARQHKCLSGGTYGLAVHGREEAPSDAELEGGGDRARCEGHNLNAGTSSSSLNSQARPRRLAPS
jgi:hypothetical protein